MFRTIMVSFYQGVGWSGRCPLIYMVGVNSIDGVLNFPDESYNLPLTGHSSLLNYYMMKGY